MAEPNDCELLQFKAALLQAEIAMNGMVAENRQREIEGNSPAYTERDFTGLIAEYRIGTNDVPVYRG